MIKLLCSIYRDGYYTSWDEDKAIIFAKRAGKNISHSLANDVVYELVKRGFFDKGIFDSFGILTSPGIQRRYLKATADRSEVEIDARYWLLDLPNDTKKTSYRLISAANGTKTPVAPPQNKEKPPLFSQIKGNESKGEKKKDIPPTPLTGGEGEKPKAKKFVKPTVDEVAAYCQERKNGIDPESFVAFYESKGWMIGKSPMKDWQAAVRTWEGKRKEERNAYSGGAVGGNQPPSKPKREIGRRF